MTKISFLVSTYDSGDFLDRRLYNLLCEQTEKDIEVVVVNPHSPGSDDVIAKKWAAVDKRVNYIYYPQREWYGESWVRAWQAAKGEFVTNANTDDLCYPNFTSEVYVHMKYATSKLSDKKVAFCYTGLETVNDFGKTIGFGIKPHFDYEVMSRECWAGPCVTWRNDIKFRESINWAYMRRRAFDYRSAFDYWLWLYFMSLGYHGHSIQQVLIKYALRPNSIENSNKWANNWETYSAISEFFPENFNTHLQHAKEFSYFLDRPKKDEWIEKMKKENEKN